jgi:hypothetical protein
VSQRGLGRGLAYYALASAGAIGVSAALFVAYYSGALERRAVVTSAILALVIQVIAFVIARWMSDRGNAIAGWGVGALICFTSLIAYGFVSRALGLPSNAALLSLATFFFLTELIEPPLLTV